MIRAVLLSAALAAAGPCGASEIRPEQIDFGTAKVVILGEIHDNPAHHRNQAAWVARLVPAAIVFEMLTPELALRAGDRGDPAALGQRLRWTQRGWPDFAMYAPIFAAAPEAAIFGGGLPQATARKAVSRGAAQAMGAAAPLFGLDTPLPDAEEAAREAEQAEAHCDALPDAMLPGMVQAQRLRDAALAQAVIAALAETDGPVAVITGNGHARRDRGIPRALATAGEDLEILSIGQFEAPQGADAPFDFWTVSDPAERGDPCAGLR